MSFMGEKRRYQRCTNLVGKVSVSFDERKWDDVELCDVSAGGIRFTTSHPLEMKENLFVHFYVYNMLSEFSLRFEAKVIRYERQMGQNVYVLNFEKPGKYQQIQLDELVKSKVSVKETSKSIFHEDSPFTYHLVPRARTKRVKVY